MLKRLGVALLVVAASAVPVVMTGGGVVARPKLPAQSSVVGLEFLGEVALPTGASFEGTEVGGLSSIVYDDKRGHYYAISDDPSLIDPVRYYTLQIDVADGRLSPGDVEIVDVTTVLDSSGAPFEPNAVDPEGIAMAHSGQLFVSSEGITNATPPLEPFIRRYNLNGRETAEVPVDDKFLPDESGTFGIRQNLGFESLAVTPNDKRLITATEAALAQDGPAADVNQTSLARIIEYDAGKRRPLAEFVYVTDPVAEPPDPPDAFRVNGLVELLPIDNHGTHLAMERSFSVGAGNTVNLYEARTQGATDVSGFDDLFDETTGTTLPFEAVDKRFLLDFGDFVVPDNLEGLAFGPDLPDGRKLLIVVSDNNFSPSQVTQFIALAVSLE